MHNICLVFSYFVAQVGMPAPFVLVINVVTTYAALSSDWAMNWIKFYGVFSVLNGILFTLTPKLILESWNLMNPSPSVIQLVRYMGSVMLGHGVTVLAQAIKDVSALDAVGDMMATLGVTSIVAAYKGHKDMGHAQLSQMSLAGIAACLTISYYILK
jgi:hypothetical protein